MAAGSSERKMRGFKRWMKSSGIECSDAILVSAQNGDSFDSTDSLSIFVKALCDLKEGDVVARIPKQSCLTVKTSTARDLILEAELEGNLAMSVAIMYERSLGFESKWFQYLQILPPFEPIPLLWTPTDIDSLLSGTEIHKVVKEDKLIMYQDWKQCIKPLLDFHSHRLNPDFFTFDEYLAARSLIASRSFQIDEYHGFGMVPLADLFNHKTAAENVHLTSVSCFSDSEETEDISKNTDKENNDNEESLSTSECESTFMEMIVVKDVKAGTEVFNTYGLLGNAALLHRYGFTEPDNPYDIVNIDLDLVVQWSSSFISSRQGRRRFRLWRMLDYPESSIQDSEYFEISSDGEPQLDLLVLLYILLLPEEDFNDLDYAVSIRREEKESLGLLLSELKDSSLAEIGKQARICYRCEEASVKLLFHLRMLEKICSVAQLRYLMILDQLANVAMRVILKYTIRRCCVSVRGG